MKHDHQLTLAATYKSAWDDGFGARGWKLDVSIDDPAVIASTSETGEQIPTSVFVHDILDHHLCGLELSGHRNEAIALTLLSSRTGSSPIPDFTQMTEEDILRGNVSGEKMKTFLPDKLTQIVPKKIINDDKLLIGYLTGFIGERTLKNYIVEHFIDLGQSGLSPAQNNWKKTGLNFKQRKSIGLCIQNLLEQSDPELQQDFVESIHGEFQISNNECQLVLENGKKYKQVVTH